MSGSLFADGTEVEEGSEGSDGSIFWFKVILKVKLLCFSLKELFLNLKKP
jgi:hypothetical protein